MDILRSRDGRLLALLGEAVIPGGNPAPDSQAPPPQPPPSDAPVARPFPDMRLALTVVPVLLDGKGRARELTFAAWVSPLPDGADPETLPMPEGMQLPGRALAPLRAIVQVSAQQLPDAGGAPQVGLSALLLRSSNMTSPAAPESAGHPGEFESAAPDIWIAGLGITTAGQMTREVEQAIRASREVLYLDTGVATRPLLESLCPRVTSLYELTYSESQPRRDGYQRMADRVLQSAGENPPVTFAIHGHPLVAATAPFLVMDRARSLGLKVRVLPGVSAIDTVLADLRLDPVVHGIQMYEATDLLLRRRPLQPDVPALLWQIGPLETCLHTMRVSTPARFDRLVAHLGLFYPPRHEVVAIYCSPHPLLPSKVLRFAIEDIGQYAAEIHQGFSLYIPPVAARPIHDHELLAQLNSVEHLNQITKGGTR